ncbi:MAG: D-hexose-6-phosphate mutarotase [Anaerolineaceae bacterium]|nr:D-hexose-6-phosphate mutarotase [Anaerolineaceae bacterium]
MDDQKGSYFSIIPGENGLKKVVLTSPDGAQAEIYLHGAQVTSWTPAGSTRERLFLSSKSEFGPDASIRGGVPVIFPQFAGQGPIIKHGFARRMEWTLLRVEEGSAEVTAFFQLNDNEYSRQIWPHTFHNELAVRIRGEELSLVLAVKNLGTDSIRFTAALHTYLRVDDIQETTVEGLGGRKYLDSAGGKVGRVQEDAGLSFNGEVDRIYFDAPTDLKVIEKNNTTEVIMHGFQDVVVWNPWVNGGAALADLEEQGYKRMVCVEAVVIGRPVVLDAGNIWRGFQRLIAK